MALVYTAVPRYLHFANQFIFQDAIERGHAPVSPFGIAFGHLDDDSDEALQQVSETYIEKADELWAYGSTVSDEGDEKLGGIYVTDRVFSKVGLALSAGIPVRLFEIDIDSQEIEVVHDGVKKVPEQNRE